MKIICDTLKEYASIVRQCEMIQHTDCCDNCLLGEVCRQKKVDKVDDMMALYNYHEDIPFE